MAKAMSVQMCDDVDETVSVASGAISEAPSGAYSCPPVPLRRRAKMKKSVAPSPPVKVTTPLSASTDSSAGSNHSLTYLTSSAPPVGGQHLSDDCAINELLEGRMDLEVHLPDGRQVKMNVERRTPMMDLLVQVTTPNKISPGGHAIHILTDRGKDFIHYKPSTPIGSLDTHSIHIVPKSAIIDPPVKKMPKVVNKPFESTFRLQVNLPHNQMTVYRVSPRTTLAEIKQRACRDKNLDHSKYQLVHPQYGNQVLDLNSSLSTFGYTEISLMSNSSISANMRNSTSDLIVYAAREDDKKKKGLLGLFNRKKSKGSVVDSSSDSMDSRGVSPTRSDSSGPNQRTAKVSIKKRPAPPPPPLIQKQESQSVENLTSKPPPVVDVAVPLDGSGSTVSHSRHSSDSSGYHEASLLSESPDNLCPDVCSGSGSSALSTDSAIAQTTTPSKTIRKVSTPVKPVHPRSRPVKSLSESALLTSTKKRKAPLPPQLSRSMTEQSSVSEHFISEKIVEESAIEAPIERIEVAEVHASTPIKEIVQKESVKAGEEKSKVITPPKPVRLVSEAVLDTPASEPSRDTPSKATTSPLSDPMDRLEAKLVFDDEYDDDEEEITEQAIGIDHVKTEELVRQPSLTSLGTIDDVQNSFDLTIAEGERVLLEELKRLSLSESSSITTVETTEISAKIESEILAVSTNSQSPEFTASQEDILSQIEDAFQMVEAEADEPMVPKPTATEEDLGWEYPIPDPPPAFRNDELLNETQPPLLSSSTTIHLSSFNGESESVSSEEHKTRSSTLSSVSSDGIVPPMPETLPPVQSLPTTPPPVQSLPMTPPPVQSLPTTLPPVQSLPMNLPPVQSSEAEKESDFDVVDHRDYSQSGGQIYLSKPRRAPLLNFTIGSYKQQQEDIYGSLERSPVPPVATSTLLQQQGKEDCPQSNRSSFSSYETVPEYVDQESDQTTPENRRARFAETRIPSFELNEGLDTTPLFGLEGSVRGIKGQVKQICAGMVESGASPNLVGRSASVMCLAPIQKNGSFTNNGPAQRKIVQRANTTADKLRKSQSVQELNGIHIDNSEEDPSREEEQERLQNECHKLQQEFLKWKQQLIVNEGVLEKQKIVPNAVKVDEVKLTSLSETAGSLQKVEDVKCQTLPRHKSKNIEAPLEEKRTFTLERQPRPKSQVLTNVTIGSWQQRKPSDSGVGLLASKFQSMEDVNRMPLMEEKPRPQRPISVHSGSSWLKKSYSNVAQDEADQRRPKIDVQINGVQQQPVSLQASVTKKDFKVPEVRQSSITRQRISPEDRIIENKTLNCGPEASTNRKPVFGSESKNNGAPSKTVTYLNHAQKVSANGDVKTVQMNGQSNGVAIKSSFSIKPAPKVLGFKSSQATNSNGTNEPVISKGSIQIKEVKSNGIKHSESIPYGFSSQASKGAIQVPINPPMPPPPQPFELTAGQAALKSTAGRSKRSNLPAPKDPRGELMLEIKNFGGRTALRKVAVNQINWQLKVHGSASSVTA